MIDNFEFYNQVLLAITSILAIWLVAKKNKWGFVVGLISQPFYFIMNIMYQQWGALTVTIIYTFTWIFGIYEWFFTNGKRRQITFR